MPDARPDVLDFLLTRRSRPAKTLIAPIPDETAVEVLLTAAARTPDHGKLEPWRFIVLLRKVTIVRLVALWGIFECFAIIERTALVRRSPDRCG